MSDKTISEALNEIAEITLEREGVYVVSKDDERVTAILKKVHQAGRLEGIEAGLEEGMIRETKRIFILMDKFNFTEKSDLLTKGEK